MPNRHYGQRQDRGWERPRDEHGRFEHEPEHRAHQGRAQNYGRNMDTRSNQGRGREYGPDFQQRGYGYRDQEMQGGGDYGRSRGDYPERENNFGNRGYESRGSDYRGEGNYEQYDRSLSGDRYYGGTSQFSRGQQDWNPPYGGSRYSEDDYEPSYGGSSPGSNNRTDSMFMGGPYRAGSPSYQGMSSGTESHQGRGPKNYKRTDARIEEDVNEALSRDHDLDATEIEVKVANGEVTLSGTVTQRQFKRMAEDIAESCSGVKDVRNEIRVQAGNGTSQPNQNAKTKATTAGSLKAHE